MLFEIRAECKRMFDAPEAVSEGPSKIWLQPNQLEAMFEAQQIGVRGDAMFAVQDDWIQYEAVPARRPAVRGGAVCGQRVPVARVTRATPEPRPSVPRRPQPAPRLRLTRRGRFVLVVLPGLLAASGGLLALSGVPAAEAAAPEPLRTTVVAGGDSLWTVAERIAPDRDPRVVVAELEQANGLTGAIVPAGAVLRLPR